MLIPNRVRPFALLTMAVCVRLAAQSTEITFRDLPDNRYFNAGGQNIGGFYRGVTLGPNVTALSKTRFGGYNSAAYPPHSGDVVIWGSKDSTITIAFASPITSFSVWYSSFVPLTLQALDQNNTQLGSVSGAPNSNGAVGTLNLLTVALAGMRSIRITGAPGLFTLSSMAYEGLEAPACTYSLSAAGQEFPDSASAATIAVSAPAGCPWTASSVGLPSWIRVVGATSGTGDGTINIQVEANRGPQRTATLTIADLPFSITQLAAPVSGLVDTGSLAHIASAGTWKTAFTLLNLGTTLATARLEFFDNGGDPLPLPLTFLQNPAGGPIVASTLERTVNSGSLLLVESSGPDSQAVLEGWGRLQTNGNLTGFAIFSNPTQKWEAVVPLETRNASSYTLAFDNTGSISTGVAIANLSASPASVPVLILTDIGAVLTATTISLPARGHRSFVLGNSYALTQGKRGVISFLTPPGGKISVLGLRANGSALTTLPVLASVGTGGGSLTHVTYNGGFVTVFTLVNAGSTAADATLRFFDDAGSPLSLPLTLPQSGTVVNTAVLTRNMAPGASLLIEVKGEDNLPSISGSAQLSTNGNISGSAIFTWKTFGQEASVPLETRTPASFFLAFDNTAGLATGLALANLSDQLVPVVVNFRDDKGAFLHTATIMLSPNGHFHFVLTDHYSMTAGKRGTLEFVTPPNGRISVIGLRANALGNLTTLPVQVK